MCVCVREREREKHFKRIRGRDSAMCDYFRRKNKRKNYSLGELKIKSLLWWLFYYRALKYILLKGLISQIKHEI